MKTSGGGCRRRRPDGVWEFAIEVVQQQKIVATVGAAAAIVGVAWKIAFQFADAEGELARRRDDGGKFYKNESREANSSCSSRSDDARIWPNLNHHSLLLLLLLLLLMLLMHGATTTSHPFGNSSITLTAWSLRC